MPYRVDLVANLEVARAYCDASRRGDVEAFMALARDDAVVWHNADQSEEPLIKSARTLGWLHRTVDDLAWTDVSLIGTAEGFLWRAVLTGKAPGGPLEAHTCVIVTLDDDKQIARVDEYLDSTQVGVLRG